MQAVGVRGGDTALNRVTSSREGCHRPPALSWLDCSACGYVDGPCVEVGLLVGGRSQCIAATAEAPVGT